MKVDFKVVVALGALGWLALRSLKKTFGKAGSSVVDAVNPFDSDNVFSKGSDAITDFFANDGQSLSTGSRFYDLLNPNSGKDLGYMQYKAENGIFWGRYDDDSEWEFIKVLSQ